MPWIIDEDLIASPSARPGTNCNAVGLVGPGSYKGDGSELTARFQMLDDDGEVYYRGRCHKYSFGPMDDFGTPNAGCTTIQYMVNGKWETL